MSADGPVDPTTPDEWQEAVNLAEAMLLLDSARQYGLVTGGPEVLVDRCVQVMAAGAARGYRPRGDAVDHLLVEIWGTFPHTEDT